MGCAQTKNTKNDITLKIITALQNDNSCAHNGVKIFDKENSEDLYNALSDIRNTLIIVKINDDTGDEINNNYLIYYCNDKQTNQNISYKRNWSMYSLQIPKKTLNKN